MELRSVVELDATLFTVALRVNPPEVLLDILDPLQLFPEAVSPIRRMSLPKGTGEESS